MADPTPYSRSYSFSGYQTATPSLPLPAQQVDTQLDAIATANSAVINALKDIRRSDGKLQAGLISTDQLAAAFSIGFTLRGAWVSGQSYAGGDGVVYGTSFYKAKSFIASSTVTPDVDTGSWQFLTNLLGSVPSDNSITNAKMADNAIDTAEIVDNAVTLAKLADIASGRLLGRVTAATGDPEVLTPAQLRDSILPTGFVVDRAYAEYTANANLSSIIPSDDTLPQVTEGTQILSAALTPKSTTNRVRVRFEAQGSTDAPNTLIAALFVNGAANAVRAAYAYVEGGNIGRAVAFEFEHIPGATSAQTYTVRAGPGSAGVGRFNGTAAGRLLGGAMAATLVVEEIKV